MTEARETSGTNQTWKEAFSYDRYGNRIGKEKFVGTTQITLDSKTHPQIDPNTNRFNGEQGYIYDKNGNLTTDAEGRSFVFNGDNKQREIKDSSNNVVGRYFYDGEGKRVKKITNTEETVFVYSSGKLVAEYTTAAPPPNPTTSYTVTDQLGSPRVITNSLGEVVSRRDFMPFGEEAISNTGERPTSLKYGVSDGVRQKFTGYQKDEETNLDFAEARMYENRHGRFTAVDPLLASGKSANPQSFNRFVYVSNNPIISTDPSGQCEAGKCPSFYRGAVYTNGTNYDNEFHEGWQIFRGRPTTFTADDGTRYGITGNGWTQLGAYRAASAAFGGGNDRIQNFIGGFNQGYDDAKEGSAKGAYNTVANLGNVGLYAVYETLQFDVMSDNLPYFEKYKYDSLRQARFGTAFEVVGAVAPGVAAAPFTAESALSVIPSEVSQWTRVGHWTTEAEYLNMKKAGFVTEEPGQGGWTYFATNGPNGYPSADVGHVYFELDVPSNSLLKAGESTGNWVRTGSANIKTYWQNKILKQGGQLSPPHRNITDILYRKDYWGQTH